MNYRDELKAFVDGELQGARSEEMRRALERDPDLAQEAAELRDLSVAFQSLPQPDASGLDQTLRALRLAERSARPTGHWGRWLALGLAGAGCFLLALNLMTEPQRLTDAADKSVAAAPQTRMNDGTENYVAKVETKERFSDSAKSQASVVPPSLQDKDVKGGRAERGQTVRAPEVPRKKQARTIPGVVAANSVAAKSNEPVPPAKTPPAMVKEQVPEPMTKLAFKAKEDLVHLNVVSVPETEAALKRFALQNGSTVINTPETDSNSQTLIMEVPEQQAESILAKLKELPREQELARNQRQSSAMKSEGRARSGESAGGMGAGAGFRDSTGSGRGGGGAGAGAATAQPIQSVAPEAKADKRMRRIKIVLRPRATPPPKGQSPSPE